VELKWEMSGKEMGRRRWISKGWKVEETVWERKRRGKGGKEGVSDGGPTPWFSAEYFSLVDMFAYCRSHCRAKIRLNAATFTKLLIFSGPDYFADQG